MAGRPTKYNDKIAGEILTLYSKGQTLLDICKLPRMPSRISVYKWRSVFPEFGKAYLVALESHVDNIVETAFKAVMAANSKEAKLVDVQFRSASWLAGRLNRQKYGDKLDVQHNVTLDITGLLAEAADRMKSIDSRPVINGVGAPQNEIMAPVNGAAAP